MKKLLFLLAAAMIAAPTFAQKTTVTRVNREKTYTTSEHNIKVWYQGEVNLGYATAGKVNYSYNDGEKGSYKTDFSRPLISTVHGVRITPYAFVGLGVGAQYAYGKIEPKYPEAGNWNTLLIPAFLNLKGYYPVNDNFVPYVSVSLGTSFCAASDLNYVWEGGDWETKAKGGFYGEYGVGINYKKLNVGFGIMTQNMKLKEIDTYDGWVDEDETEKLSTTSFYVKIGIKF